jgi:hypothetical protein
LALRLAQVQTRRFASALDKLGGSGLQLATTFLTAMIDPSEQAVKPFSEMLGERRI